MARGDSGAYGVKTAPLPIKGFLPSGMLDWPGKIAATVFLGGCNFRCPYCHNAEIVVNADMYETIDEDSLISYLNSRKMWVEHMVVTGGEPTIARRLPEFLAKLKANGFKVKLDTNGSKPKVLSLLIKENLVDYIAMDVKGPFSRYPELVRVPVDIEGIKDSVKIIVESNLEHEFRTTVVPGILSAADLVEQARQLQELGVKKLYLQQFQNVETLDPEFLAVKPYPAAYLEDIKERIKKFLEVEIRGV